MAVKNDDDKLKPCPHCGAEVSVSELASELIELVDDVLDPLGTRKDVEYIFTLLKEGSSADRQLACYDRTDSLEVVVDQLSEETMMDC